MPEETVVVTETPAATDTRPLDERLQAYVDEQVGLATTEQETVEEPKPEEAAPAPAAGEAKTDEAKPDTKEAAAKVEVAPEQLGDPKYWGSLDADGWQRMERDYPVETKHVKAAQAAATRIVNEARKSTQEPPKEESNATPMKPDLTEAIKAAKRKRDSLDEDESLEGELELAELLTQQREGKRREVLAAQQKEMNGILANAKELAVAEEPELANTSDDELDAVVDKSPKMRRALSAAIHHPDSAQRAQLIADVMVDAYGVLKSTRQSATATEAKRKADEKTAADQARMRSNANNSSVPIAETPSGKSQSGPKTFEKDGMAVIQAKLNAQAVG